MGSLVSRSDFLRSCTNTDAGFVILTSRYLGVLNTIANCEGNKDKRICHRAWLLTTWLLHLHYFEGVGLGLRRQKFRAKGCYNNKLPF